MKITLAFDVYGTLIDTAGVVSELKRLVGDRAVAFSQMWRDKQLEYSFRRALMDRYEDFSVCVGDSLDYTSACFELSLSSDDRVKLLNSFSELPRFDDVEDCLTEFAGTDFEIFALSNGSREAVAMLLESSGIARHFIDVVSVEEIKTFKPNPAVYQHFLKRAAADGADAWLISGNPFDVIGAVSAGMRAAWVKRTPTAVFDPWGIEPTITVSNLAELKRGIEAFCRAG